MKVSELFTRLSYGELSNLAIGGDGSGSIPEASQPKIISYTNDGLLRLYSRFVLKENSIVLNLNEGITNYRLTKRYALSNNNPIVGDVQYIIDSEEDPYTEDLIRILQVTNAYGERLVLNDMDDSNSLFTPEPNMLQIPNPVTGAGIGIVYQANHSVLLYDDLDADIEIPITLIKALTSYIAYQVYDHMNGQDNAVKAATYIQLFNGICEEITEKDLVNSSVSTSHTKFDDRGFV